MLGTASDFGVIFAYYAQFMPIFLTIFDNLDNFLSFLTI